MYSIMVFRNIFSCLLLINGICSELSSNKSLDVIFIKIYYFLTFYVISYDLLKDKAKLKHKIYYFRLLTIVFSIAVNYDNIYAILYIFLYIFCVALPEKSDTFITQLTEFCMLYFCINLRWFIEYTDYNIFRDASLTFPAVNI